MKAFILGGGFGTKLREVIYNQPKILAQIKGQAFIDHLFYLLKKRAFTEIVLSLGYLSDTVKTYVTQRPLYDMNLALSVDQKPMGTGGALKNAEKFLSNSTFFMINGDTYLDFDYSKALEFHQKNKALVTIVTAKNKYPSQFGKVEIDKKDKVTSFKSEEITQINQNVHAGVFIIEPEIFSLIPAKQKYSFEKDILPNLISKGKVFSYFSNKPFYDIGKIEGYKLAQENLER